MKNSDLNKLISGIYKGDIDSAVKWINNTRRIGNDIPEHFYPIIDLFTTNKARECYIEASIKLNFGSLYNVYLMVKSGFSTPEWAEKIIVERVDPHTAYLMASQGFSTPEWSQQLIEKALASDTRDIDIAYQMAKSGLATPEWAKQLIEKTLASDTRDKEHIVYLMVRAGLATPDWGQQIMEMV